MNVFMEKIRLDKFVSSQLGISRTDAKKLIRSGCVLLNGKLPAGGDVQFDAENDEVCVNGKQIRYKKHIYIMMDKPKGIVSASESPNEKNVIDLVPEDLRRNGLFPAGRLDKDTTGFVLITDDGEFAHNILSPAKHISKTYIVSLEREVRTDEYTQFEQGMELGDIVLKPASLKRIEELTYEIVITEGRYHQIKRMFLKTGNRVTELRRIKMGSLMLDPDLKSGECRELTTEELTLITN